jgi:hypothetical protein
MNRIVTINIINGTKMMRQFLATNTAATSTIFDARESLDLKQHNTINMIEANRKQITAKTIFSFGS